VKKYVLDANAALRFLMDQPGADRVDKLFQSASRFEAQLFISVVNRGEVLYTLARRAGIREAESALQKLSPCVESVEVSEADANAAALLKLHYKLGFADCFAAELAMRKNATLVTADPEFARLGKRLKLLALPRHKN
jgi:predicted nucleic acid-binding protein